jgi:TrmH family RNA methyltransferase
LPVSRRTPEVIRSAANPVFQRVRAVRAGKEREHVLLEGARLALDALRAGLRLALVLVDEARAEPLQGLLEAADDARIVDAALLQRVSGLETAPGVLALAERPPARTLESLDLAPEDGVAGLALGVAGIGDPGNLGALARSAEAAGARALLVAAGGARPFGEKALRGSMGSLLRLPVIDVDDTFAAITTLTARGLRQATASIDGGTPYTSFDFSGPFVLWMPGEVGEAGTALESLPRVRIPMAGRVESLNVAVAASVLLFAAGRAPKS